MSYLDGGERVTIGCATAEAALTCLRTVEALTGAEAAVTCDGEEMPLGALTDIADREAPDGPPPDLCWSG